MLEKRIQSVIYDAFIRLYKKKYTLTPAYSAVLLICVKNHNVTVVLFAHR